jgi:predicted nucleotidyltransferase
MACARGEDRPDSDADLALILADGEADSAFDSAKKLLTESTDSAS